MFLSKVELSGPIKTEKSPKQSIQHHLMDISFCTGHLEVGKKLAQIIRQTICFNSFRESVDDCNKRCS